MNRSSGFFWGFVLIAIGMLFLLDNLDMLSVGDVIREYWPVLLVLWGIWMIVNGKSSIRRAEPSSAPPATDAPRPEHGASQVFGDLRTRTTAERAMYDTVFGDLDLSIESTAFKGGVVSTVFGDCTVDLLRSTFAAGEDTIRISAVFGDVSVLLPPGTPYALAAHTLFGAIHAGDQHRDGVSSSIHFAKDGFEQSAARPRIEVSTVFGDVTVRS